jgi:hypothetical protein
MWTLKANITQCPTELTKESQHTRGWQILKAFKDMYFVIQNAVICGRCKGNSKLAYFVYHYLLSGNDFFTCMARLSFRPPSYTV